MTNNDVNEMQLMQLERINTGSSRTNNDELEKNGYCVVKNFWDPIALYHPVPRERGQINYWGDIDQFNHDEKGGQVFGGLTRVKHPQYETISFKVGKKLKDVVSRQIYPTHYFDRFYFPGTQLSKFIGGNPCEISVLIHISTNLKREWPIWIKTPDTYTDPGKTAVLVPGQVKSIILEPGDALIFKGCERPTWRDPMPINPKQFQFGNFWIDFNPKEDLYYHDVYFNYVLSDGSRAQCAYDMST